MAPQAMLKKVLYQTDLRGSTAIVLGAEGAGMRRLTRATLRFLVAYSYAGFCF